MATVVRQRRQERIAEIYRVNVGAIYGEHGGAVISKTEYCVEAADAGSVKKSNDGPGTHIYQCVGPAGGDARLIERTASKGEITGGRQRRGGEVAKACVRRVDVEDRIGRIGCTQQRGAVADQGIHPPARLGAIVADECGCPSRGVDSEQAS